MAASISDAFVGSADKKSYLFTKANQSPSTEIRFTRPRVILDVPENTTRCKALNARLANNSELYRYEIVGLRNYIALHYKLFKVA